MRWFAAKKQACFLVLSAGTLLFSSGCGGAPETSGVATPTSSIDPPSPTATSNALPADTAMIRPTTASYSTPNPSTPIASAPAPSATPAIAAESATAAASPTPARPSLTATPRPPTATPPPPTATPAPAKANKGIVFAYYVPYDPTSWASLQAQADKVDFVAPQWVYIDACGNIGSRDDRTLVAFARSKGIKITPSLLTLNDELNHRLLTDEVASARAIEQITAYVVEEGYDGLDLDLENVKATDRNAYTAFVKRLSAALRSQGKLLTAAVPAKPYDATTGWAGAYEYAAVAPYFDLVTIMTYEYSSPTGKPGSTAPVEWVDKVIAYVTSQIPSSKVLVGVAFYGYDWNVTVGGRARSLRYPQAAALANNFGATISLDPSTKSSTFSYVFKEGDTLPVDEKLPPLNHEISERRLPQCPVSTPTPTPRPTTPPRPTPTPPPVQEHVVWLEDARSVGARLGIATKYGTAGIGTWRLGQEDPATWSILNDWRQSPRK